MKAKEKIKLCLVSFSICFVAAWALFYGVDALAEATSGDSAENLGTVATRITQSFSAIGKLMISTAYLAGIGFGIAAIFKFKQHKDNPTQIPVGTPIALFVISMALVFLPYLFAPAGQTIFGSRTSNLSDGLGGGGVEALPGQGGQ